MIGYKDSLLGYVARRHTTGREDAATDALCFILSRSDSARRSLSELLGDDDGSLPIARAQPWQTDAHGAVPDLACLDGDGKLVALIESKFWARLTAHQPVIYWERLPSDRPAVLLFLAPASRVDEGSLWDDLVERLGDACHELGPANRRKSLVTAPAKVGHHRLMLTSWELLLDRMAERANEDGDDRARFEIAELRGLADGVMAGDNPQRDEKLKQLLEDAVKRLKRSGWADAAGLSTGSGDGYYGRYLRLAGAAAGLRIDYEAAKQMPDRRLWLWFHGESDRYATVSAETVRGSLGDRAESLEWLGEDVCVPIALPVGADREATLDAIVAELESIAELIDPNGPTYGEGAPIAGDDRPTARTEPEQRPGSRRPGRIATKVVSWNIATMHEPWRELVDMDADVALLQEVGTIPEDVVDRVELSPHEPWLGHDPATGKPNYDRWPMVVRLSDRVRVEWMRQIGPMWVDPKRPGDMAVGAIGTVEVARVVPTSGAEPFIAASMYARWLDPHPIADGDWIYSDASAHSIISDLSAFIGYYDRPDKHRILAAGDLNMSFQSTNEFDHRAQTVLDRFRALGLEYMGPRHPAGRRADPIPEHLNEKSLDVPTYYHKPSNTPAGAYVQLDHVFASRGFHNEVQAKALNGVGEWGPSDHCRIWMDVGDDPTR